MECWSIGVMKNGVLECWNDGGRKKWSTGVTEYWNKGILE
jgi:hypothetical protein